MNRYEIFEQERLKSNTRNLVGVVVIKTNGEAAIGKRGFQDVQSGGFESPKFQKRGVWWWPDMPTRFYKVTIDSVAFFPDEVLICEYEYVSKE
ncbi:hypothetical protein Tco_1005478 [Tanacetum coccineum]|uniref:Uncharacterized protein n=1 Tax=Tanacetum coccineum TaxID=301880 RepID=A0ABQ5FEZ2_9ASTR